MITNNAALIKRLGAIIIKSLIYIAILIQINFDHVINIFFFYETELRPETGTVVSKFVIIIHFFGRIGSCY